MQLITVTTNGDNFEIVTPIKVDLFELKVKNYHTSPEQHLIVINGDTEIKADEGSYYHVLKLIKELYKLNLAMVK